VAICLDASFIGALLLPEELSNKARSVHRTWLEAREAFIAPTLLVAEVTSLLRKAVYTRRAEAAVARMALELFGQMPITYFQMPPLTNLAWTWGETLNTPRLYDMFYLALADAQDCELWVVEKKLVNIVGSRSARVRWVGDLEDGPNL